MTKESDMPVHEFKSAFERMIKRRQEIAARHPVRRLASSLAREQLDGSACLHCGQSDRPMVPVPGVESSLSTVLFICDTTACKTTPDQARALIRDTERKGLPQGQGGTLYQNHQRAKGMCEPVS